MSATTSPTWVTLDANEAVASVAYRASEVIAIYPITPASPMGEHCDEWSTARRPNLWGSVPEVVEMQAEGGAAGAIHGAVQAGALGTTFTASQGLLLMIPNMYKIAGELTPFVMHVASRTIATHALSIFGDHSDVMACRQTGLRAARVGLGRGGAGPRRDRARGDARVARPVPAFLRRVQDLARGEQDRELSMTTCCAACSTSPLIAAHRRRALTPDHPVLRGTAQNPDTFFQAREASNPYYLATPGIVRRAMDRFAQLTGRQYAPFDYAGHPEAERVVVVMGSAAETAHETAEWLAARGEQVGVLKVRLYRPFSAADFLNALPHDRSRDRRARPDEGTGRARRAALPGRRDGVPRGPTGGRAPLRARARRSSADATGCRRRSSRRRRPRRCSTSSRASTRARTSRSGSSTTSPTSRSRSTRTSTSSPRTRRERSSSGSGRTARSARTRTRSRSSARRRRCSRRATSSTTRRSRARSRSRTCGSARDRSGRAISSGARASSRATSLGSSTATTCSTTPRRARSSC